MPAKTHYCFVKYVICFSLLKETVHKQCCNQQFTSSDKQFINSSQAYNLLKTVQKQCYIQQVTSIKYATKISPAVQQPTVHRHTICNYQFTRSDTTNSLTSTESATHSSQTVLHPTSIQSATNSSQAVLYQTVNKHTICNQQSQAALQPTVHKHTICH